MLTLREFSGPDIGPYLDDLGGLRIAVFREFPYLYQGTLAYERKYLATYLKSPRSLVVLAFDGDRVVGATTCAPLADEEPEFQEPFLREGYEVADVFYLAESVLLPEYRGGGTGREFFRRREAQAERLGGFRWTAFCAVERPADHPLRPADYKPLHGFWQRMGYTRHPELHCEFTWKEIGEPGESPKPMTFWLKERG
ncbi:MAG: GNAT family N-acetyltransferase [Verrucomicrobiales bacterium]